MAIPRFLVNALADGGMLALDEAESRHAAQVLRLSPGAEVILFDGQGGEALATVAQLSKRAVTVHIERRTDTNRELTHAIELVVALPKGDRQKTLVEALVQLGVTQLTPLASQRGVAQPNDSALGRLERYVIEASKQCGRNQLMKIGRPVELAELALSSGGVDTPATSSLYRLFAHPYGPGHALDAIWQPLATAAAPIACRAVVGPEGGFTDEECQLLRQHDWLQAQLGPRVLRVEMAAMAIAARWSRFSD